MRLMWLRTELQSRKKKNDDDNDDDNEDDYIHKQDTFLKFKNDLCDEQPNVLWWTNLIFMNLSVCLS